MSYRTRLPKSLRGALTAFLLLGIALSGMACAPPRPPTLTTPSGPATVQWTEQERTQSRAAKPLAQTDTASYLFVRLSQDEPMHRHDKSDATIILLSGHVRLRLGDRFVEMRPGDVVFIPRGTAHGVKNLEVTPAEAFAIFSPVADRADRIYLE